MADPRTLDPAHLRAVAKDAATRYKLDPDRFIKQIETESGFRAFDAQGNPLKATGSDATGVAQITSETAKDWGVDPTDPVASIYAAASHVKQYEDYFTKKYGVDPGVAQKLAVAAYHDGQGGVDKAVESQGGGDWGALKVAAGLGLSDEGKKYVAQIFDPNAATQNWQDVATEAKKALGLGEQKTQKLDPNAPVHLPNINDPQYTIPDPNNPGQTTQDTQTWSADYLKVAQAQSLLNSTKLNPQADYFDSVIKEMTAEIAAGNLSVSKANSEMQSRLEVYKTIAAEAPKLAQYSVPADAEYVPGREPGGFYTQMGLPPLRAQHDTPVDLFGMGTDLARRAGQLAGNVGVPDVPGQGGAALRRLPGAPPPTSAPAGSWDFNQGTPWPQGGVNSTPASTQAGGDLFVQALQQIGNTGAEQQMRS